jgi:large subunit ribosomal protein L6
MSKFYRVPVVIKEDVSIAFENGNIKVSGPKGALTFKIPIGVNVKIMDGYLQTMPKEKNEDKNPLLGLTRAIIANMITGVSTGFEKKLELSGVGFKASLSGKDIILSVGFSHPVKVLAEEGITYSVADNIIITVSGIDKALVGNVAAKIRAIKPPEPYKGKGIRYKGEIIRRKAGKAAKAIGTK